LGKVIDKVTSLAQKAYNPDRYLHEAIINTVETIKHCQVQNTAGVLLAVDLHKAFDSVFHEFMREVYKFFGFGEYFIRLSETLGNGRCAKIIFDDGKFSDNIELARCRPQGDSPSPRQFNMCQQICIFKLELDPAVKSVYLSFVVPRPMEGRVDELEDMATEEEMETAENRGYKVSPEIRTTRKKVSSFADDLQAAVRAEYESLSVIKNSMIQFGFISGLCTNVEKTTMMRIGNLDTVLDPRIEQLGFGLVTEMKILGFDIDNKAEQLEKNFDKCISKMRQIVGNWSRFRLTLPGRIAIAKSLLLSQITFHGTVLDPTPAQLNEINQIIESFVTYKTVIAKERIYLPVKKGGLGMVNIESFLAAQKCAWLRRCFVKINDVWRWDFLRASNYSLSTVRLESFDKNSNPVLWNIAKAVCRFQTAYWRKNENYLEAYVFNNDFFLCEKPRPRAAVPGSIKWTYLRRDTRNEFVTKILSLKMKDLIVDGNIVDHNRLCAETGIPFTANEYMYVTTGARYARERYGGKPDSNGKNKCIEAAVYLLKGNSKSFRRYMDLEKNSKSINEQRVVKTFFELIEVPVPVAEKCEALHSVWNLHVLPNNIRVFAFQFYNNSLATNSRLAARYRMDPNIVINDRCDFCIAGRRDNPPREDFVHVFFDCPLVKDCVNKYLRRYGNQTELNDMVAKKCFFFTGAVGDWREFCFVDAIQNIIFLYGLWQCKVNRKVPNFTTVEHNMLTIFDSSLQMSTYLSELAGIGNTLICRLWRNRSGRG
jgi:hypothetical protein